jgi:hypothetical protein
MRTRKPARLPSLEGQLALVAELQSRFRDLLDDRLDSNQIAEALRIAHWLNDSALCIARLKKELSARGGDALPPWIEQALDEMNTRVKMQI